MEIFIYDNNGDPVQFTITTFFQGKPVNTTTSDGVNPSIDIFISNNYPLSDYALKIQSKGFKTISATLDKLTDTTIFLEKSSLPYLQLIAVAALLTYATKHKKKVGEITENHLRLIALGLGGILAFDTLRKVLEGLGLWKSRDTKVLDDLAANPGSFWSPQFYLTLLSQGHDSAVPFNRATANQWLKDLDNAFHWYGDNEATAKGILKRAPNQIIFSFVSWVYNQNTGGDFLSYVRGQSSWLPWGGLSDADVNEVTNYIARLPKY